MVRKLKFDQKGDADLMIVPLIMAGILLLVAIGFGGWAFNSRQDYKNNSDKKAAAAAELAAQKAKTEKDNEFVQKEKEPLKIYTSSGQYGSIVLKYPKTWSVWSDEKSERLVLLMQPDIVSSNDDTPYSLKLEVNDTPYDQSITRLDNDIKQGKLRASAYSLPRVPNVLGLRVDGQIALKKTGTSIYLPLRDSTIILSAQAPDKISDLDNIILPNMQFTP